MTNWECVGQVKLDSKILVIDPCYSDIDDGCVIDCGSASDWYVYANYYERGNRVANFMVCKTDNPNQLICSMSWNRVKELYVDSAQMAVMSVSRFDPRDEEYGKYCAVTEEQWCGVVSDDNGNYAAVTTTGYGDGAYTVYTIQDPVSKYVLGILIEFIEDDDDEEEEEDEDDW